MELAVLELETTFISNKSDQQLALKNFLIFKLLFKS